MIALKQKRLRHSAAATMPVSIGMGFTLLTYVIVAISDNTTCYVNAIGER